MKSITDLENLNNQIVLLRLDLNVPILDGKITDTNRIDKIIPTINFLLKKGKNNHNFSCWKARRKI